MPEDRRTTIRQGVRRHRDRLREQGMRPVQLWLPDVRSPEFQAEARRQSEFAAASPYAAEDQAFADDLSAGIWNEEE